MTDKDFQNTGSLTDEIADIVRQRILKGEYKIGEKIKESQIAAELNVSRTPIRDAFRSLEIEGLIDYVPNKGCYAKGFTKQDVEDIYSVREALEELAVKWAAERIEPEELKNLEEQCDLMEFYTKKGDTKKVLALNSGFHNIIYNGAKSRFLGQVLRSYKEYLDKTRTVIVYDQSYLDDILSEHREILDSLKSRDGDRALVAIRTHLSNSQKRTEEGWNIK